MNINKLERTGNADGTQRNTEKSDLIHESTARVMICEERKDLGESSLHDES
jgi:hypothetical protein